MAEDTAKSPEATARSVQFPIGLVVLSKNIPRTGKPSKNILTKANNTINEKDTKKAIIA